MGRNEEIPAAAWRQVVFWGIKRKGTSFGSFYLRLPLEGTRKDTAVKPQCSTRSPWSGPGAEFP